MKIENKIIPRKREPITENTIEKICSGELKASEAREMLSIKLSTEKIKGKKHSKKTIPKKTATINSTLKEVKILGLVLSNARPKSIFPFSR